MPNTAPIRAYLVIKHGIKMSGMPAWGAGAHDDQTLWSLVAFVNKLPSLTPAQYEDMVRRAPADEDEASHSGLRRGSDGPREKGDHSEMGGHSETK